MNDLIKNGNSLRAATPNMNKMVIILILLKSMQFFNISISAFVNLIRKIYGVSSIAAGKN